MGKRIKELERLYGIQNGGDRGNQYKVAEPNNSALAKSQSDLATQMGISVDTLQNYKMLADMIPELDELVTTGIVTKTTALAIMRNLSEDSLKIHLGTYSMYLKVKIYFIWVHPSYQFCAVYIYIDSYYQEKNITLVFRYASYKLHNFLFDCYWYNMQQCSVYP